MYKVKWKGLATIHIILHGWADPSKLESGIIKKMMPLVKNPFLSIFPSKKKIDTSIYLAMLLENWKNGFIFYNNLCMFPVQRNPLSHATKK